MNKIVYYSPDVTEYLPPSIAPTGDTWQNFALEAQTEIKTGAKVADHWLDVFRASLFRGVHHRLF